MRKLLLVEDDAILLKMYHDKFVNNGYEIIVAEDGEQALKQAELTKPDFIILDLMLPKLNGVLVLKILKEKAETKDIPIAILTVMPEEEEYRKLLGDNNIYAYWRKDETKPSDILKNINEYFDKKGT